MLVIYNFILLLLSPFILLLLAKEGKKGNRQFFRWGEYFGRTPPLISKGIAVKQKPLWIHAVSVGECIVAIPIIKELKANNPSQSIVVTTTTTTGATYIESLGDLVEHRYMPTDFGFAIRKFLKAVSPKALFIIETELWPNTLHNVAKANIPIVIVNARLSDKSKNSYAKVKPLFQKMSQCITQIICQSPDDKTRFVELGVNKEKLSVSGSIKYDISIPNDIAPLASCLRAQLGETRPVWIASSTHKGEDEILLQAHQLLLKKCPNALLIMVPRHPERFDKVYTLSSEFFTTIRRTSKDKAITSSQVYLADTMGEMLMLLSSADVCFMGGSLLGDKVGGHNMLEPAAVGLPTITGASYYNFKDIANKLIEEQALNVCSSPIDISDKLYQLFTDSSIYNRMKDGAKKVVRENQGALGITIHILQQTLTQESKL